MSYILKNKDLEICVDNPLENYNFSRFDWTGKIVDVKYKNIQFAGFECLDCENENILGKGFYNEFGKDFIFDYDETKLGCFFHKIGVGLLKKDDSNYQFIKSYEVEPAEFEFSHDSEKIEITCKSKFLNGFCYLLKKEIQIHKSSFTVKYSLQNTGEKDIITSEYLHNFIAINKDLIGTNYILKFPFHLKPDLFENIVNPELKVEIGQNDINFNDTPNEPFFYENLNGGKIVDAKWELLNIRNKVGISEVCDFKTNKINLWGCKHVISPELFIDIFLKPGQSKQWSRTLNFFEIS